MASSATLSQRLNSHTLIQEFYQERIKTDGQLALLLSLPSNSAEKLPALFRSLLQQMGNEQAKAIDLSAALETQNALFEKRIQEVDARIEVALREIARIDALEHSSAQKGESLAKLEAERDAIGKRIQKHEEELASSKKRIEALEKELAEAKAKETKS